MYARIILVVLLLNAVRRSEGEAGGITSEDTIGAGDTAARSESAGKNNGEAEAVETSEDRTEEGRNGAVETVAGSKGETAAQGAKNGVAPGGSNDACVTQKHADESGSAGDAGKKTEGHLVNCQTIANSAMDKFIKQSPNAGNNELSTPPLERADDVGEDELSDSFERLLIESDEEAAFTADNHSKGYAI
ncbi:unnamed protein product [Cylicocyclus nassatus]|uniref:Secreted protein n=1 Tax=Cylicocyclus nassatus TaxID=53992 RepID=A0AA36DJ28_CYLNA|nr:unnamed protein product [Cylicocyclus nassatus]